MKLRLVIAIVMVIGCSSSSSKTPDAGSTKMDAAAGNTCTGLVYDSCNPSASNCMSGLQCKNYPMPQPGFNVCIPTTACSASNPCPMQNGQAVTCNNMGLCKPNGANTDCVAPQ